MDTQFKAMDIASFFIKKGVTPLQLQKLLYYSQSWFYVKTGKKLFADKIQAWIYGPVVHSVWSNFKYMKRSSEIHPSRATNYADTNVVEAHLNEVWNAYGHLTGSQLVDLTHEEISWKSSRKGLLNDQPSDNEVIVDDLTTQKYQLTKEGAIPKAELLFDTHFGYYSNDVSLG